MIVLLGGVAVGKPFSISQMTRAKPVCAMAWRENVVAKQQPLPIFLLRVLHSPVVEVAPLREYCRPDQPCVVDAFHHRRQAPRVVPRLLPVGRDERVPAIHLESQRLALLRELLRVEKPVVGLRRWVKLPLEVVDSPLRELHQRKLRCGGSGHQEGLLLVISLAVRKSITFFISSGISFNEKYGIICLALILIPYSFCVKIDNIWKNVFPDIILRGSSARWFNSPIFFLPTLFLYFLYRNSKISLILSRICCLFILPVLLLVSKYLRMTFILIA